MEKTFKDNPRFYSFCVKYYYNTFSVRSDIFAEAIRTYDFSERRNVDQYLMSGEYPEWVSFPVVFHQYDGMKLRDLMAWADEPFIISDRTVNLLEDNHITGWKTFPVEIYDKKGNLISGYQGFSVTGRGGSTKDGKYKISQWDGSDIFMIGNGMHHVIERVKILLEENKIDAAEFEPFSYEII